MHYAIIAAGEGSRLAQEGVPVPKPMVRLDDRPMLKRLIDIFAAYKAESISVIASRSARAGNAHTESRGGFNTKLYAQPARSDPRHTLR